MLPLLPWLGRVSRVSLDSVERINWNEEKDAPKEKINTEIVFTDLRSPPLFFAPLSCEVSREIHKTRPRREKRGEPDKTVQPMRAPKQLAKCML